jgi:exodeoxyribonuclease V beta subunit
MTQPNCQHNQPKNFDLVKSSLAGINLIDASAGTGKTYTICGLVLRLLLEKNLTIDQILVVTYTEAATEDLRDRIRQKIHQAIEAFHTGESGDAFLEEYLGQSDDFALARQQLTAALRSFDEAAIFTIHSFCQRILREHSFESTTLFDTELVTDDTFIIREIVEDFWRQHFYQGSNLFIKYACQRVNPEKLFDFLATFLPHPQITFIPIVDHETAGNNLSSIEDDYAATYRDVCHTWPAARKQVHNILLHSKALNRNQYGLKKIPLWLTAMDAMAATCIPAAGLFDAFRKFTSSKLTTATKKNKTTPEHPFFELCEKLTGLQTDLHRLLDSYLLALQNKLLFYFKNEFPVRKKKANIYSFDDLLRRLHDALTGSTGRSLARTIGDKYPAALIDEFQDTDPLQFTIFSTVYQKNSLLFLIGDPKQAIYSFRGADIFTYMHAAGSCRSHHTLGVNHRSSQGLVKAVNTLFCRAQAPFMFDEIDFQPAAASGLPDSDYLAIDSQEKTPFILWFFRRPLQPTEQDGKTREKTAAITKSLASDRIISAVTWEITRLLNLSTENSAGATSKKILPADIAILVRTNREARLMQQALNSCRVPSVLHSSDDLFASQEAREMEIILSAIAEPSDLRKVKTALLTNIIGLSGPEVQNLDNWAAKNQPTTEAWLTAFHYYFQLWQQYSFIRMFWAFMEKNQVRVRMLGRENGERSLTNILHLAELLHHAAGEKKLSITGLLGFLRERLTSPQTLDSEHQLRLESDANRVRIVTIHKAKGLEYPIVFCPFAWEGTRLSGKKECLFHQWQDPEKDIELIFDAGSPDLDTHLEMALQEELAENLRLLYVALTRAVHRCYLAWGAFNSAETSAPAYLFHQPLPKESDKNAMAPNEQFSSLMHDSAARFKNLTDQEIIEELEEVVSQSGGAAKLTIMDAYPQQTRYQQIDTENILQYRKFTGNINSDWRIASFSSLTSKRQTFSIRDSLPDRDIDPHPPAHDTLDSSENDSGYTIFSFPHGARPGTFFHDLLEHLDFNSADKSLQKKLITEKLMQYGYEIHWYPAIADMLDNLLKLDLHANIPELKLSKIQNTNRLNELEFYFPLAAMSSASIKNLFTNDRPGTITESKEMPGQLGRLMFSPVRGFMKGFIDLVFEFGGKYYLLDWKSNYLGNRTEDYQQAKLAEVMWSRYYFLQYHIYCLAVHQYLQNRLPGYQYDRHFGGVFYIFMRGVNRNRGPDYGIFYDLPDPSLMTKLSTNLLAVKS